MAEVTNELMYELLKRSQARFDKLDDSVADVKRELNSLRGHMVAIQSDLSNIYGMLGRHDDRLDRIERRPELRELAEAQRPYEEHP